MGGPLRVGTLNVRGLSCRRRQYQVQRLLHERDLDVVAIQETKVDSESGTDFMVAPFQARFSVSVSHACGNSAGCCVFVKNSVGIVVESVVVCDQGRFVACDFSRGLFSCRVVCLYAPTKVKERLKFFQEIEPILDCKGHVFVLGDFNCVWEGGDRRGGVWRRDASADFFAGLVARLELVDAAHLARGGKCSRFTHHQGASQARLDRIYVSADLAVLCENYNVEPVSFSDHSLVMVTLGKKKQRRMCYETWKFNAKLLNDEVFVEAIKEAIVSLLSEGSENCEEKWEHFKQCVKLKAMERGSIIQFQNRQEENSLRQHLEKLLRGEAGRSETFTEDVRDIKQKLEVIDQEKFKGAVIRARSEKLLGGESPTKRTLSDEKMYARKNEILEIEYKGVLRRDQVSIQNAFEEHYAELFSLRALPKEGFNDEFLVCLPKLESAQTESLEREITVTEIIRAIENLNPGKSPGPDGLTAAFYKEYKYEMAVALQKVFSEALEKGALPISFSRAHTILLPKCEEEAKLRSVNGYRPITLTNVDYKIFMKVLANRLQSVIGDVVGGHQTCGIRGRSIFTNIHVARSILECCDNEFLRVAMLQIDLSKAFDRVPHEVLFSILRYVGLGSLLCEGVRMAYSNCTTSVIVNGELSRRIDVRSSVRQGCPMSPLLFSLFLEPLCRKILGSDVVHGFQLESSEVRILAYADDVAIFATDRESVRNALRITQKYCDMSGSLLNRDKCLGVWHGAWDDSPRVFENVQWDTTPALYLGVPLDRYRENTRFWRERATDARSQTERWAGRDLSIFARATVCNVFLAAKIWYVLQALYCTRANLQLFHRVFATFVWNSGWERTARTNLFRTVGSGGLGLGHLFLKQVVSRFMFLRDQGDPFLRTYMQVVLASELPSFLVSSCGQISGVSSRFLREVVFSFNFLSSRFSVEYLGSVTKRVMYKDLVSVVFPVPLYRNVYAGGPGQNVLKRVKKMWVTPSVKTFFFNLHTGTLPVLVWMQERGLYVPWGTDCRLCKKPETVEHVFIDCWDAVFYWDVLQRALQKDLPVDAYGIRFLPVVSNEYPYDAIMLLGLHSIWRSRIAVRNSDPRARSVQEYFVESVARIREVMVSEKSDEEVLSLFSKLSKLKVHWFSR